MSEITVYIVPAWSDQAGQCRIVQADGAIKNPRDDYRQRPDAWKEIGLMNSRGELVCLEASPEAYQELKDCEPLCAGTFFRFSQ